MNRFIFTSTINKNQGTSFSRSLVRYTSTGSGPCHSHYNTISCRKRPNSTSFATTGEGLQRRLLSSSSVLGVHSSTSQRRFTSSTATRLVWPLLLFVSTNIWSGYSSIVMCEENEDDDIIDRVKKLAGKVKGDAKSFDFKAFYDEKFTDVGSKAQEIVDSGMPGKLSYGFICGFTSGLALKKVGRAGAVVAGLGFVAIQTLSYSGYVKIDFEKMNADFNQMMDLNNDGEVDEKDVKLVSDKVMEIMSYNIPAGSGFGAGFLMGVRAG